jgi:hypothetical protein
MKEGIPRFLEGVLKRDRDSDTEENWRFGSKK